MVILPPFGDKGSSSSLICFLLANGGKLTTVRVLSNSAELETRQQEHHDALLRVHGRTCQGRRLNLVETKFRLPVDEIFSLLLKELRMHEADSALKSSVTGAPSHSKTVSRTEKISKRPRGHDDTAV